MKLGPKQWAFIMVAVVAIIVMAPSDNEGDSASHVRTAKQRSADSSTASPTSNKQRQPSVAVGHVELNRLERQGLQSGKQAEVGNVFNTTSWYVPPPAPKYVADNSPPAPPPPPPAPTAPPLPFTYLGRYSDEFLIIILLKGDRIFTVAEGDVIENTYRVDKLSAGTVNLTYLPLNIVQTLRTGDTF